MNAPDLFWLTVKAFSQGAGRLDMFKRTDGSHISFGQAGTGVVGPDRPTIRPIHKAPFGDGILHVVLLSALKQMTHAIRNIAAMADVQLIRQFLKRNLVVKRINHAVHQIGSIVDAYLPIGIRHPIASPDPATAEVSLAATDRPKTLGLVDLWPQSRGDDFGSRTIALGAFTRAGGRMREFTDIGGMSRKVNTINRANHDRHRLILHVMRSDPQDVRRGTRCGGRGSGCRP